MTLWLWLHRSGKRSWFTLAPALVMIITTIAALSYKLFADYLPHGKVLLAATDILLLALAVGVGVLAAFQLRTGITRPGAVTSS